MRTYQVGKTLVVGRGPIGRRLAPRGLIGRVDPGRLLIGRCCGGGGTGSEWNLLTRQRRRTLEAGEGRSGREKVEGRIAALAVAAGGGGGGSLRGLDLARLAVVARDLGPRRLLREEVGVDHGGCFDWAYCFLLLVLSMYCDWERERTQGKTSCFASLGSRTSTARPIRATPNYSFITSNIFIKKIIVNYC